MELWGANVKPDQTYEVNEGEDKIVHLSQSCIGEGEEGKEQPSLITDRLKKSNQLKLTLAWLSLDKPQVTHDLILENGCQLSHSSKTETISFSGYLANLLDHAHDAKYQPEAFSMSSDESDHSGKKSDLAGKNRTYADPDSDHKGDISSDVNESDNFNLDNSDDFDQYSEEVEISDDDLIVKKQPDARDEELFWGDLPLEMKKVNSALKSGADGSEGGDVCQVTPNPPASGGNKRGKVKIPCKLCNMKFGSHDALKAHTRDKHSK